MNEKENEIIIAVTDWQPIKCPPGKILIRSRFFFLNFILLYAAMYTLLQRSKTRMKLIYWIENRNDKISMQTQHDFNLTQLNLGNYRFFFQEWKKNFRKKTKKEYGCFRGRHSKIIGNDWKKC